MITEFSKNGYIFNSSAMNRKQLFVNLFKIYKRAKKVNNMIYFPQFV